VHGDGSPRSHGSFLAGEVGELVGVSGTTIGQWARRGYIRASVSDGHPHVYAVEDLAEAVIVAALLERGVRHADVRRAIERLGEEHGRWPLSDAVLGTIGGPDGHSRIVLHEREGIYALGPHGWQQVADPPEVEDVRWRLRRIYEP
jgi:DNA-binding transcriptional MerR regulator